jgi:membrane protease YdiL (CAAX protease family)
VSGEGVSYTGDVQYIDAPPPEAPASRYPVPWTIGDVLRALIIPGIFFGLNVIAGAFTDAGDQELSEADLVSTFGISMGFQVLLLGLVWFFSVRKYHASWKDLGLRKPDRGGWYFPFALVMAAFFIVYAWVGLLLALGIEGDSDVPDGTFDYTSSVVLLALLSLGFAPIVEELFFRGFVFGGLRARYSMPIALAIGGGIFGLAHAGTPDSFIVLPAIAGVGALFAWGYTYTGSLFASIGAHFLFNLASLVVGLSTN